MYIIDFNWLFVQFIYPIIQDGVLWNTHGCAALSPLNSLQTFKTLLADRAGERFFFIFVPAFFHMFNIW